MRPQCATNTVTASLVASCLCSFSCVGIAGAWTHQSWDAAAPAVSTCSAAQSFHAGLPMAGRVDPEWEGSAYSYVRPSNYDNDEDCTHSHIIGSGSGTAPTTTLRFPGCGTVTIEQHRDRVVQDGDGDGDGDGRKHKQNQRQTGFALWSAALAVADYVDFRFGGGGDGPTGSTSSIPSALSDNKSPPTLLLPPLWNSHGHNGDDGRILTCLELGAGLGLPSIVAARHGLDVVSTECDPAVLPLLMANLRSNLADEVYDYVSGDNDNVTREGKVERPVVGGDRSGEERGSKQNSGRVIVHSLDWSSDLEPSFLNLFGDVTGGPDLIIASDVVYGATRRSWPGLIALLVKLRDCRRRSASRSSTKSSRQRLTYYDGTEPSGSDPIILLGYTQRRRDMSAEEEGRFFSMVREAGMEARPIPPYLVPNSDTRILTTVFELRWL
mmetsp:Transcript_17213/g.34509  ORF Transcript_17213/g.34509 Transcript_17213/m.34509 type:complete len:439 (-) Transcript_17213:2503-3819(-)